MLDHILWFGRFLKACTKAVVWYLLISVPAAIAATWLLQFMTSGFGAVMVLTLEFPILFYAGARAALAYRDIMEVDGDETE